MVGLRRVAEGKQAIHDVPVERPLFGRQRKRLRRFADAPAWRGRPLGVHCGHEHAWRAIPHPGSDAEEFDFRTPIYDRLVASRLTGSVRQMLTHSSRACLWLIGRLNSVSRSRTATWLARTGVSSKPYSIALFISLSFTTCLPDRGRLLFPSGEASIALRTLKASVTQRQ